MLGLGVRTVATEKLFSQGNLVETGNAFDVAIEGRGLYPSLDAGWLASLYPGRLFPD